MTRFRSVRSFRVSSVETSSRGDSRRSLEGPAQPTETVGMTACPLRGLGERVATVSVRGGCQTIMKIPLTFAPVAVLEGRLETETD